MKKFKLYGRAVPTTDCIAQKYAPHLQDVALYASRSQKAAEVARYTTPDLRRFNGRKSIIHNCFRYGFEFLKG